MAAYPWLHIAPSAVRTTGVLVVVVSSIGGIVAVVLVLVVDVVGGAVRRVVAPRLVDVAPNGGRVGFAVDMGPSVGGGVDGGVVGTVEGRPSPLQSV